MKKSNNKRYEAPQAEVIAIEAQSVLCTSGGPAPSPSPINPGGDGFHFGNNPGQW